MNKEELIGKYQRLAGEAKVQALSAPHVELVYRAFLEDLAGLEVGLAIVRDDTAEYVTVKEAARLAGVSKEWIYKHRAELSWVKKYEGGLVRCDVSRLRRWQEKGRAA